MLCDNDAFGLVSKTRIQCIPEIRNGDCQSDCYLLRNCLAIWDETDSFTRCLPQPSQTRTEGNGWWFILLILFFSWSSLLFWCMQHTVPRVWDDAYNASVLLLCAHHGQEHPGAQGLRVLCHRRENQQGLYPRTRSKSIWRHWLATFKIMLLN